MYVSKVQLKNIRGIGPKGLTFDFTKTVTGGRGKFAGWTVVAGPNGAGKTTLLQGMAGALVGGPGSNWLLRPDDRRDWVHHGKRPGTQGDQGTACTWVEWGPGDPIPARERRLDPVPLLVEWGRDASFSRNVPPEGEHSFVLRHFWNAGNAGDKADGWLFAGYGPHRGNPRTSPDAALLYRSAARAASVVSLFRDDAGLEAANLWLVELEIGAGRAGGAREKALRDGVLQLLGCGLLEEGQQTRMRVEAEGLQVEWDGGWRPLRILGDGYRAVLSLVMDLLSRINQFNGDDLLQQVRAWQARGDAEPCVKIPGTVVIDEPEIHLHPELQQRVGFWMKAHFPEIQFIVTTHSPLVCQAADEGGLFRLASGKKFAAVDQETWTSVAGGTIDDAVVSSLFGMDSSQSSEAAKRRRQFAELEVKRVRAGLTAGEQVEHAALSRSLPTDPNFRLDTLVQAFLRK